MDIEFDPAKSARNFRERGYAFSDAARLFDGPILEKEDRRRDYGEIRINTLGEIDGRVFFATYTRRGEAYRIISFRKAKPREVREFRHYVHGRSATGQ
jgi:uncharacterized DUF497 family protein